MPKARICRSIRNGFAPTSERTRKQGGVVKEVVDRDVRGNILI